MNIAGYFYLDCPSNDIINLPSKGKIISYVEGYGTKKKILNILYFIYSKKKKKKKKGGNNLVNQLIEF